MNCIAKLKQVFLSSLKNGVQIIHAFGDLGLALMWHSCVMLPLNYSQGKSSDQVNEMHSYMRTDDNALIILYFKNLPNKRLYQSPVEKYQELYMCIVWID